jgi:hypothetical protein
MDKNRIGAIAGTYFTLSAIVFFTTLLGFEPPQYAYLIFSPADLGLHLRKHLPFEN